MNGLAIVQLIVYVLLIGLAIYLWRCHGRPGFLGWGYIAVFCAFRIIGGGIAVGSSGTGAAIMSYLGIGPLLLGADGILTEARTYRYPDMSAFSKYLHLSLIALLTALCIAGMVQAGTAGTGLLGGNNSSDSGDPTNAQIGVGLIFAAWIIETVWGLNQLKSTQHKQDAPAFKEGTLLLHAVFLSLIFFGIRITYALVAVATQKTSLNPVDGSLAVRVILSFLPELAMTVILLLAGYKTKSVVQMAKEGHSFLGML